MDSYFVDELSNLKLPLLSFLGGEVMHGHTDPKTPIVDMF
jgi:hypothetical protein